VYEELRFLPKFRIPITTLSGSLPKTTLKTLFSYLNLSNDSEASNVYVLQDENLLGNFPSGFKINVSVEKNPRAATTLLVKKLLRQSGRKSSVHVIFASKEMAEEQEMDLRKEYLVGLVCGETDGEEQVRIAGEWREGHLDILLTTTCGVVGNESSRCRHVIVVGYLYDLQQVVQAIGRLRPRQRTNEGTVDFLLHRLPQKLLAAWGKDDEQKLDLLRERKLVSDVETYSLVGTRKAVVDWLTKDTGCMFASLARRFGYPVRDCGGVCHTGDSMPDLRGGKVQGNLRNEGQVPGLR